MNARGISTSISFSQACIDLTDGLFTTIPEGVDGVSPTDLWNSQIPSSLSSSSTSIREMPGSNFEPYISQCSESSIPGERFGFSKSVNGMTVLKNSQNQCFLLKTLQITAAPPLASISGSPEGAANAKGA
jgi:hypothetical protein